MVSINEKIKELRLRKGIKQSEVARSAGIKQSSYASIEKGEEHGGTRSITIEVGKGIAKALGVSFIELFEIETPSTENNEETLKAEIYKLQNDNKKLEEQLQDKRMIIEFLSSNDLLVPLAFKIYHEKNPDRIRNRDFHNIESLQKEIENMPFNKESKESVIKYIRENSDILKSWTNE